VDGASDTGVEQMMAPQKLADLLSVFDIHNGELEYFMNIVRLLSDLNVPQEVEYGVALMEILEIGIIYLRNGEVINADDGEFVHSVDDAGVVAAVICSEVNEDPKWWARRYFMSDLEHEINVARKELGLRILDLPGVERLL
jgi:hypothetical protein